MEVGDVKFYKGQRYECVALVPHTRRDGMSTTLAELVSDCATCGERFAIRVPSVAPKFQPNRRCRTHKRPGQVVRG